MKITAELIPGLTKRIYPQEKIDLSDEEILNDNDTHDSLREYLGLYFCPEGYTIGDISIQ